MQLFLNGRQVFPDDSLTVKLTRENPYFSRSDSYTFDVSLPMHIRQNRAALGHVHRIDQSKAALPVFSARLYADNELVLRGTARVVRITQDAVSLQLLGGSSEVNFLSADNGDYVDELDLGTFLFARSGRGGDFSASVSSGVRYAHVSVNNEDDEEEPHPSSVPSGRAFPYLNQYCLVDIVCRVIAHYGYDVVRCDADVEPWNCLYVATAKTTTQVSHTLPHWTVREFLDEVCAFFNATIVTDELTRRAAFVFNPQLFAGAPVFSISPDSEYQTDVSQDDADASVLCNSNISFGLSSSPHHDYDCLPDSVREGAPRSGYDSYDALRQAYAAMTAEQRRSQLFACPRGLFAAWLTDYSDVDGSEEQENLIAVDVFSPLIRDASISSVRSLKVVPVAMARLSFYHGERPGIDTVYYTVPSLENPTGSDFPERLSGEDGNATIQDYVMGSASLDKSEKEDLLQVMFVDDVNIVYSTMSIRPDATPYKKLREVSGPAGFTSWLYKEPHTGSFHRPWSLSLNPTNAEHYLGELHRNPFRLDMHTRLVVSFLWDRAATGLTLPPPTAIYNIRGRRYLCEKMEASVTAQGILPLITGHFREIVS